MKGFLFVFTSNYFAKNTLMLFYSFNMCILLACNICSLLIIMAQKYKVEGKGMA